MLEVIIAAIAGLLGAALGSWATMRAARTAERAALTTARITPKPRKADVEFVDASFVAPNDLDPSERTALLEGEAGESETGLVLDLKLRNRGGETAYLYELTLDLRNSVDGFQPELPKADPTLASRATPSHVYRAPPRNPGISPRQCGSPRCCRPTKLTASSFQYKPRPASSEPACRSCTRGIR
ncbi:hypothetical protein [Streptomyces sp. NPDC052012]|uniref:hypothetical protein n=1 Tax=Streptomyces sp. NPDC052012 TaxID=3155051 RepID=UPI00344F1505